MKDNKKLYTCSSNVYNFRASLLVRAKYIDHFLIRYPTKDEFESVFKYQGTWNAISNYFYKEEDNNVLADASNIVIF